MSKPYIFLMVVLAGTLIFFSGLLLLSYYMKDTSCETFAVSSIEPQDRTIIGAIQLCGKDLEWGNVKGPYYKYAP